MRVVVASRDSSAAAWLEGVLRSAGLSVVVLSEPTASSPELTSCELLIADRHAAASVGNAGPERRILLVPKGQAVGLSDALGGGFMDLLVVPAPEDEVLQRVGRALDRFLKPAAAPRGSEAKVDEFKQIVERVVHALELSGPDQERTMHDLVEGMLSVFLLVLDSHEATEQGTPGHSRRTGPAVRRLALALRRPTEEAAWLELSGRLHDIGHVPLTLKLDQNAPLSQELRRGLEKHPDLSAEILRPLERWGLPVDAIAKHHERIDGSGYPRGLKGDDVPLEAQILGAADVFEALTSPRPWRGAATPEEALEAMRRRAGFSPEVLDGLADIAHEPTEPPGPLPTPRLDDDQA